MKNSVYNFVDDVPVVQEAGKVIDIILSKPELAWAALIDTAFDYGEKETRPDFGSVIDCYDFPELKGLRLVAPCLITLVPQSGLHTQVTGLIRHCQGRPMLSFVGTTGTIRDISARWRLMHMVSVIDEQEMLLRFADTRILAYLPQVLAPQWREICSTLSYWMYFDRSGHLVSCDIPDLGERAGMPLITKEQLEKLLDASRPDALMALIAESMSDIVPVEHSLSERYHMIKDAYEMGRRNDVNDNADILALAVAAYISKGKSSIDQRLASLLKQRTWPIGALGDAIVDAEII